MVRAVLVDDEEAKPLPFIGSMKMGDGVGAVLASIRQIIRLDLSEFRAQASPESAFALLRSRVEATGIFVLLMGNLGSHHSVIDVEAFRGFALVEPCRDELLVNRFVFRIGIALLVARRMAFWERPTPALVDR
jgi:hypothetical protein